MTAAAGRDRLLDRALRVFAPVRAGEGGTVLLMALNIFLLMTAYYVIKPVREALILAEWGAEAKIYASAGQALLLLGIVPLYSRLAGLLTVRRLITAVNGNLPSLDVMGELAHGRQMQYEIRDGRYLVDVAGTPFEVIVYKIGNKHVAARSNEFGYANYEIEAADE